MDVDFRELDQATLANKARDIGHMAVTSFSEEAYGVSLSSLLRHRDQNQHHVHPMQSDPARNVQLEPGRGLPHKRDRFWLGCWYLHFQQRQLLRSQVGEGPGQLLRPFHEKACQPSVTARSSDYGQTLAKPFGHPSIRARLALGQTTHFTYGTRGSLALYEGPPYNRAQEPERAAGVRRGYPPLFIRSRWSLL
jgi:hypothetical protein